MASPFRTVWKESGEYVLTTGDTHTTAEQLEFSNLGSKEYFRDMTMDLQKFEALWIIQQVASSLCLYLHTRDGDFVGLSRTSIRGKRAWLAGIFLAPEYRGRRLGPLLFEEYLTLLKERSSVEILQFECVLQNHRALKMYQNFGCVITGALYYYHVDVAEPDANAGSLELVGNDTKIDLRLPWLQHSTAYSWQREFSAILSSSHQQLLFRRPSDDDVALALAVDTTSQVPRINAIAYSSRPRADELLDCFRRVAAKLDVSGLEFTNEPETSDVLPLLEVIARRNELSQKHLSLAIERSIETGNGGKS